MMRTLLLAGWLAVLLPVGTQAQITVDASASTTPPAGPAGQSPDFTAASQGPLAQMRPNQRCCSLGGVVIGAVIGASAAIFLVSAACERECTSSYIKGSLFLGFLGAAVGASVHPTRRGPVVSPRDPAIHVSPVISPRARGVMVAARF
jgi:hypothetical protein